MNIRMPGLIDAAPGSHTGQRCWPDRATLCTDMDFRLLGVMQVEHGGVHLNLGRRRERCLLGLLLLEPGKVLPSDRLLDLLWDDEPPDTGLVQLRSNISRLRTRLKTYDTGSDAVRIRTHGSGYCVEIDPGLVDLHRFRQLLTDASSLADPCVRAGQLRAALALWRGPIMADVMSDRLRRRVAGGLEELRVIALERLAEADLQGGHPGNVISELAEVIAQHPLRERLTALLMIAHVQAGNPAESSRLFHRLRARLADELGMDPGAELNDLHDRILRQDPSLLKPAVGSTARGAVPAQIPAQLPADIPHFTGRAHALRTLDALAPGIGDHPTGRATAVVISAVSGTAGVGKTALAVHWAHRVRHRFPDGQLYVNLRGFDPIGAVMTPAEAIRRFLDALEVPPERIPATFDAQAALYRSRLADRKMLVLLDNARDADHVRPLLPGSPGCLTLVTSRNQLTSLVASHGALPLMLELLSSQEARDLMVHRLGRARTGAEPEAVDRIAEQCARLPLALAIVAAHAITQPDLSLRALTAQLHDPGGALDTLSAGDAVTDVRTVFSWSYRALSQDATRLFRLLGLHPGPDLTAPAAASLAGVAPDEIAAPLAELTAANLLMVHTVGRYALHDLLRAYAVELVSTADTEAQQRAATHRMLDHYLHTAHAAAQLMQPNRKTLLLAEPQSGTTPDRPADPGEATGWFAAERAVLRGAVDRAAAGGYDAHVVQLAWATFVALSRRGDWQELADIQLAGAAAAARMSDVSSQAGALRYAAHAHSRLGRFEEADSELGRALALYRAAGNRTGEGLALQNLAALHVDQGHYADALGYARQASEVQLATGHSRSRADSLDTMAWSYAALDRPHEALAAARQALGILVDIDDVPGQASVLKTLGLVHHKLGEYREAVNQYERALAIYHQVADRYDQATTLDRLGDAYEAAGDEATARDAWRQAHRILTELSHPDAAAIQEKLDEPPAADRG